MTVFIESCGFCFQWHYKKKKKKKKIMLLWKAYISCSMANWKTISSTLLKWTEHIYASKTILNKLLVPLDTLYLQKGKLKNLFVLMTQLRLLHFVGVKLGLSHQKNTRLTTVCWRDDLDTRVGMAGAWRRLYNEQLHNLYTSHITNATTPTLI
jgi:hypothetical protein